MSGFEVEEITPVASDFSAVVVGEVIAHDKHPHADQLSICEVNIGRTKPLTIVCGAANVRKGMKTAGLKTQHSIR